MPIADGSILVIGGHSSKQIQRIPVCICFSIHKTCKQKQDSMSSGQQYLLKNSCIACFDDLKQ